MKLELVIIIKENIVNFEDPDERTNQIFDAFNQYNIKPIFKKNAKDQTENKSALILSEESFNNKIINKYHHAFIESDEIEEVRKNLIETDGIESAYIAPLGEDPVQPNYNNINEDPNSTGTTPLFTDKQVYLGIAPDGIDALYAWTLPGGKGESVSIVDIERAWNITHEDSPSVFLGSCNYNDTNDQNNDHGTAVLGILGSPHDKKGVNGICPDASIGYVSKNLYPSPNNDGGIANAIYRAIDCLVPGNILLIEVHRPGPRYNFKQYEGQLGYIPVEWWPAEFHAIKEATNKGIIVVEAGGNGNEWLEDPIYFTPGIGFPPSWSNPFARGNMDSGAILVGAGAPPSHVNGNYGENRTRIFSSDWGSNYGNCIDAQGWGESITTCGNGDLFFRDINSKYTRKFGGTSGAAPMVAGALACVQGILKKAGKTLLTPATARDLLRKTGSPQVDNPNDIGVDRNGNQILKRIGNRPNLRELINESLKMS